MTASRRDPHLGELAAALVDGALDHGARDRALAHLTRCDACRTEVEAQRRLKAQLVSLVGPGLPAGFGERLRSLPDRIPATTPVGLPPDRFGARFRPGARPRTHGRALDGRALTALPDRPASDRAGSDRPGSGRPGSDRPAGLASAGQAKRRRGLSRRRQYAATAAGGLAAFALALAAVAAVGESDGLKPVAPQVGTFILDHSRDTGGMPGPAQEVGVVDAANTTP